jgi:ribosomal-protein-alanine N-acetyltransferase
MRGVPIPAFRPRRDPGTQHPAASLLESRPTTIFPTEARGPTVSKALTVRLADERDLDSLHAVDQAIFGGLAYPYFVLRQIYDAHHEELLVALHDDQVCGYSLTMSSRSSEASWFQGLGVVSRLHGRGIGRRLASEALSLLELHGVRRVRLTVRPDNDIALGLCVSLGFQRTSRAANYLGPGEDRLLLDRPLRSSLSNTWAPARPQPKAQAAERDR